MTTLNMVPEFSDSDAAEVKQVAVETPPTETETPADLPPQQETVVSQEEPAPEGRDDSGLLEKQLQGLQEERVKLLKEIQELRGTKRELKKDDLQRVDQKIDDLKDVNPEDVSLIDKVLRSKGYLTKEESQKMLYETVKQERVNEFLEEFPEYKPENDPNDINWNTLVRGLGIYATPQDPKQWSTLLKRAHKDISGVADRSVEAKRQQIKVAGVGSGGVQRSPTVKTLDPAKRSALERGGWSDEEIKAIESKL